MAQVKNNSNRSKCIGYTNEARRLRLNSEEGIKRENDATDDRSAWRTVCDVIRFYRNKPDALFVAIRHRSVSTEVRDKHVDVDIT